MRPRPHWRGVCKDIQRILFEDWDPIGVKSEGLVDEYDAYVAPVFRALQAGTSAEDIVELLSKLEREEMGLTSYREELRADGLRRVADKLLQIDVGASAC